MNSSSNKQYSSIEAMERLMDQMDEFKKLAEQYDDLNDPAFRQEYRLFKQYIRWRIEDINRDTHHELDSLSSDTGYTFM